MVNSQRIAFMTPVTGWTPDRYIIEFWDYAQGYVVRVFRHRVNASNVTLDDLTGVAIEGLIRFARDEFETIVERMGATPTDKRLFWACARRYLNFAVTKWLDREQRFEASVEELEEEPSLSWMRSNLSRHSAMSTIQDSIVDRVAALPAGHQLLLALRFYEEMTLADVATLTGYTDVTVRKHIKRATDRILEQALSVVTETTFSPTVEPLRHDTSRAERWAADTYGADIDHYLQFVLVNYRHDVSYLVDFLDAGNGKRIHNGDNGDAAHLAPRSTLTSDQVHTIRERLDNGDTAEQLAADYPVSIDTIWRIKRGVGYAWVPVKQKDAA